jgi:hypothetical protein
MFRPLKILLLILVLATSSIFIISCGGSSKAKLRIVQAIPDVSTNSVDIYLDGNKVASSVGFEGSYPGSGYQSTGAGSRHLQVFLGGQTTGALFDGNISLNSGSDYTVVLTGFSVGPNVGITASLFPDTNTAPTSGNVSIRAIHAAPTWSSFFGNMDVWIVGPPYTIGGTAATFPSLAYTKASSYTSAPAGTYEAIATQPGVPAPIVIGGPFTFNSGDIRTIVFVDAPGGGLIGAPLVLNDLGQ